MGFCLLNNAPIASPCYLVRRHRLAPRCSSWTGTSTTGTARSRSSTGPPGPLLEHPSGPLYPGTGAATDFGSGAGQGYMVNLPVPPGRPDEFLSRGPAVAAVAWEWRPGLLVLISAGYDAHRDDPLANCELDDAAYWDMAATMRDLAGELGVPLLICLEGGYSLAALARSVVATLDAVSGGGAPRVAPSAPGELLPGSPGPVLARAGRGLAGAQAVSWSLISVISFFGRPGTAVEVVDGGEAVLALAVGDHAGGLGHRHAQLAELLEGCLVDVERCAAAAGLGLRLPLLGLGLLRPLRRSSIRCPPSPSSPWCLASTAHPSLPWRPWPFAAARPSRGPPSSPRPPSPAPPSSPRPPSPRAAFFSAVSFARAAFSPCSAGFSFAS